MKKVFLIFAIVFLGCRKSDNENPELSVDFGEWANTGNSIFNDGGLPPVDSIPNSDSILVSDVNIEK